MSGYARHSYPRSEIRRRMDAEVADDQYWQRRRRTNAIKFYGRFAAYVLASLTIGGALTQNPKTGPFETGIS